MAIGTMTQTISTSTDITQLQSAINQQFSQLTNVPIINGAQIKGVTLTSGGVNQVAHKLGRQAMGYFISSISVGVLIWNDAFDDKFIPLHCSANCTVDMWVF